MPSLKRAFAIGLAAIALGFAFAPSLESAAADSGETFTTQLQPGFNLAGWIGPESGVDALFDAIPELEAVYAWDAGEQRYRSSSAQREGDLTTLTPGMGLWLKIGGGELVPWTRRAAADPWAGLVSLHEGWNLVGWAGQAGVGLGEAVAGLGSDLEAALTWDAEGKRFRNYFPGAEESTGAFPVLSRGDALWLYSSGEQYWLQPSKPELKGLRTVHVTVKGPDGQSFWEWNGLPLEIGAWYYDFETGEEFYSPNAELSERGGALLLADGTYSLSVITGACFLGWYTQDGTPSGPVGEDELMVSGRGASVTINLGAWPDELDIRCRTGARYRITGRVVDESGGVRTNYEITAHPKSDITGSLFARTDGMGAFGFEAPDGYAYTLTIYDNCRAYVGLYQEDEGIVGILGDVLTAEDLDYWERATRIPVAGADVTGIEVVIPAAFDTADECPTP